MGNKVELEQVITGTRTIPRFFKELMEQIPHVSTISQVEKV